MSGLTKSEAAWLRKFQKLLNECPSKRLGFFTTGDATVTVYDNTFDDQITDIQDQSNAEFATAAYEVGAYLCFLDFPSSVHSTAG